MLGKEPISFLFSVPCTLTWPAWRGVRPEGRVRGEICRGGLAVFIFPFLTS